MNYNWIENVNRESGMDKHRKFLRISSSKQKICDIVSETVRYSSVDRSALWLVDLFSAKIVPESIEKYLRILCMTWMVTFYSLFQAMVILCEHAVLSSAWFSSNHCMASIFHHASKFDSFHINARINEIHIYVNIHKGFLFHLISFYMVVCVCLKCAHIIIFSSHSLHFMHFALSISLFQTLSTPPPFFWR